MSQDLDNARGFNFKKLMENNGIFLPSYDLSIKEMMEWEAAVNKKIIESVWEK